MKSTTSSKPSSSTTGSRHGGGTRRGTEEPPPRPEPHPYLDKLVMKINVPENVPGHEDFVPTETFPDLYRYSGVRSVYEPQTAPPVDSHGTLTPQYKHEAFSTLKTICRDEIELNTREAVFKKSHKQFIDDIMNDMEKTHSTQAQRQNKHWLTSKSKLGFSASFNVEQGQGSVPALSSNDGNPAYSLEFESTAYFADPEFADSAGPGHSVSRAAPPSSSQSAAAYTPFDTIASTTTPSGTQTHSAAPHSSGSRGGSGGVPQWQDTQGTDSRPRSPLVPAMLSRTKIGHLPPNSSQLIKRIGYRPPNKMALFNALLDTTPAPHSPRKRYGTVDMGAKSSSL